MNVLQLDLSKAFDRVKHSAVISALKLQGCSLQCLAVLCAMLNQSKVAVSLGHVTASSVDMMRGLPQGAPESPLIFVLVTEFVLRPLLRKWRARGSGWSLDLLWLAAVCYADDILLISSSRSDLEVMAKELIAAFGDAGLDVSAAKCHWTSYPPAPTKSLIVESASLSWEAQMTFVGTILEISGNDGAALENRLAKAVKVFHTWAPFLQCRHVSVRRRLLLLVATVFSSALWLAETWLLTKQQREHLESWGARLAARVCVMGRRVSEEIGQFWRRLHRRGHRLLRAVGGGLDGRRAARMHSFAGHVARSTQELLSTTLHTRCLSWWRFQQARYQSRHDGIHPKRFKTWRWESQLTEYYGEVESEDAAENVGWMLLAQNRDTWKGSLEAFLRDTLGGRAVAS